MRSTVAMLSLLLSASACASNDDEPNDDNAAASSGSTADGTTGGDIANPDGTTGGDSSSGSGGDFGLSDGDDDSGTGSDTEGDSQGVDEGFEDVLVGEQPGEPWEDAALRIVAPTIAAPTAVVIETTDAEGGATQALQTTDAIGTSQGLVGTVGGGARHRVTATVRVDQFSDAQGGSVWPLAVGFVQEHSAGDLNEDPHAVLRIGHDGSWNIEVRNAAADGANLDAVVEAPAAEVGRWYEVMVEVDASEGAVHVTIADASSGEALGENMVLVANWNAEFGQYDAVAFYDGEYDTEDGTQGGQASVDNVSYEPVYGG